MKVWYTEDLTPLYGFEDFMSPVMSVCITPDTAFLVIGTRTRYCIVSI